MRNFKEKLGGLLESLSLRDIVIGALAASALGIPGVIYSHGKNVDKIRADYQLKCEVNTIMESEFRVRYPAESYPQCNGCSLYANIHESFMSGHPSADSQILDKAAADGIARRSELTEKIQSGNIVMPIDHGCR